MCVCSYSKLIVSNIAQYNHVLGEGVRKANCTWEEKQNLNKRLGG